jgi:hypothetical protein
MKLLNQLQYPPYQSVWQGTLTDRYFSDRVKICKKLMTGSSKNISFVSAV